MTFTTTAHDAFAATVPPASDRTPDPAVPVAVPPQVFARLLGVATTSLAGKLSVKATPWSAIVFADGLAMVTVNVLTPFG